MKKDRKEEEADEEVVTARGRENINFKANNKIEKV